MKDDYRVSSGAASLSGRGRPSAGEWGAAALLTTLIIACLFAPVVAPFDPVAQPDIIGLRSQPPTAAHPFGTDAQSRDVLSRVLFGGRVSLGVGLLATLVSVSLGTIYGAVAGYARGATGVLMQRLLDTLLSIPRILLLIAIFAFWRDLPLIAFVGILGATGWYGLARLVRGQVLALRGRDFVVSARALGASHSRILLRHILPNLVTTIVVAATIGIGHVIVLEAGLSYLGMGVSQPTASWGSMIQDGSADLAANWWMWLFPGVAIVLSVLAINILSDALVRALQPRLTGTE